MRDVMQYGIGYKTLGIAAVTENGLLRARM